ncbi:hypothetical protein JCM16161A_08440 [Vulcanisaeta sp. JCM 16161]|uniref:ATP-binding protein n=1 Tax=Vulcanisaeta sp. JCM 16161 TaxID=1295372 RepID=UPI0006D0D314|nr:ATP-binding protein [Vulcanisaeta sp. JCM 16161]
MRRIRLGFASNVEVEFADREQALSRVKDLAERGMALPWVVYGPEGCGKTAWLRQSAELLRGLGFNVIYVNPLESSFMVELGIAELKDRLMGMIREAAAQFNWGRVIWSIIDVARTTIEVGMRRLAVIVDDAFQVIGTDKAAIYVKGLLGILEHPPRPYERVIAIAATSEGMSLREIGRHLWSITMPIWNMGREGFRQLYDQIPGSKPDFEEVWKLTGGNPRILEMLYEVRWDVNRAIERLILDKKLTGEFIRRWRRELGIALNDPDYLWNEGPEELTNELVDRNLIVFGIPNRDPTAWVDEPPPERDPELGIGKYVAWQSPLHREAIRRALEVLR